MGGADIDDGEAVDDAVVRVGRGSGDVRDDTLVGAEAGARWKSAFRGQRALEQARYGREKFEH